MVVFIEHRNLHAALGPPDTSRLPGPVLGQGIGCHLVGGLRHRIGL